MPIMPTLRYAILEAPSTLGLASNGVERLPDQLLALGLAQRIHARRAGRLAVPAKDPTPDAETGTLNAGAIAAWSPQLADAVEAVLDAGEFPIVLGGDCTIVLGSMLALRRRGRYGLLFIDGNADFFQPEAEPNGEGASMDLAFVTGHGPSQLTDIEGRGPLVRPEDAVAFAYRDHKDQEAYGSQPLPKALKAIDLPAVHAMGIEAAARSGRAPDARRTRRLLHPSRCRLRRRRDHAGRRFPRAGRLVVERAGGRASGGPGERQGRRPRGHHLQPAP